MAIQVYSNSDNGHEVILEVTLASESKINSISVNSHDGISKTAYLNVYLDGTTLSYKQVLMTFEDSFNSLSSLAGGLSSVYPSGAKLEVGVVYNRIDAEGDIDITMTIESGTSITGINPVTGTDLIINEGTTTIAAGATETLIFWEYDGIKSIKSLMIDTTNANVTVNLMFDVNDSYALVKSETFSTQDEIFTYSSQLTSKAARVDITNNGTASIDLDWNYVLIKYKDL